MELATLLSRLKTQDHTVTSFEGARVVRRSFETVLADVRATCDVLKSWGVRPGMRVGIRAPNSYPWLVHDLALLELRAVSVAFTDDFAALGCRELRDRYALSLLLVTEGERAKQPPEDTFVASMDGGDNSRVRAATEDAPPGPDSFDQPWLTFSSGSVGGVKGMVLNRKGIETSVAAFTEAVAPQPDDCLLLFLPISSFQQRMMYYAALWYGFDLILADPPRLFLALKELKPTILIAPPMLYEAIETRFHNLPAWKRAVAWGAGAAIQRVPHPAARAKLARLVFKQAYEALGGRMRFMVTGMAPIKRSTLDLFARMQLPLFEAYGLTETGPIAVNLPTARKLGSVGRPLPGSQIELAPDGEIIIRREHMQSASYFEATPEETQRTFLGDNRIATGDIGRFDADGYLYLVGRKKEIIVTAGGEKIHPEAVEAAIDAHPDIAKSVVLGGPGGLSLAAVILPKVPEDAEARARIHAFVENLKKQRAIRSVDTVIFTDVAFTRENGLLRPNLKLDRRRIAAQFQPDIESAEV